MSKAFTKETDGEEDDVEPQEAALPAGTKNYITPSGFEKLRTELRQLIYTERPKLVETIAWAASNGDRSENGDYIYGKRRLREIDRRVRFLNKRLDATEVIDPAKQQSEKVLFGATVTVLDEAGKTKIFQIVGIDESDPGNGRISWTSPLAKALLGHKTGDVILFVSPKGEEDLEIEKIEYV